MIVMATSHVGDLLIPGSGVFYSVFPDQLGEDLGSNVFGGNGSIYLGMEI